MANLNLQDILDMFQNGERRYSEEPTFKAAVDSLKMGLGVYAVLDHVLKDQAATKAGYAKLVGMYNELANERNALALEFNEIALRLNKRDYENRT